MLINFLINVFKENRDNKAIVWRNEVFNYQWLLERYKYWKKEIRSEGIERGAIVIVEADFSPIYWEFCWPIEMFSKNLAVCLNVLIMTASHPKH